MITNRKDMINDLSKYMNSRKGNKRDLVNIGVIVPISRLQKQSPSRIQFHSIYHIQKINSSLSMNVMGAAVL